MTKYPLVIVKWLDHTGDSSWKDPKDSHKSKPAKATTIGWLVHEDKKTVKIYNTILTDGTVGGEDLILKSCITSRHEYELHE